MDATIDDVKAALASKQITCRALVEHYIRRIEAYDKCGPALNAVQTINRRAVEDADAARCGVRGVGPGRSAALCSDAHQGSGRDERHADDVRVGGVQGFRSAARRDDRHEAEEGGRGDRRQDDDGRIRVRLSRLGVRRRPQRLRSDAERQRLVGRHRRRHRRELRNRRHRRGHRRIDPRTGGREQSRGTAADAAARQPVRDDAGAADAPTRSARSRVR